jgi:hypothetical protein
MTKVIKVSKKKKKRTRKDKKKVSKKKVTKKKVSKKKTSKKKGATAPIHTNTYSITPPLLYLQYQSLANEIFG